jgi:cell division GTPase FtsZ
VRLLVIGCGSCGGRIADRFTDLGRKARADRHVEILTAAFAITTDSSILNSTYSGRADSPRIVLIGGSDALGRADSETNEAAAAIARDDIGKVMEAVGFAVRSDLPDAFLLIAGAAGSTGSGIMPVVTRYLKEEYPEKPVYNLVVLPFEEEMAERPTGAFNAGACLKSAYLVADAVFLFDNQRYYRVDATLKDNPDRLNTQMVAPFYGLLCAGEEKKPANIGGKTLDAGDIIQSLEGWSTLGHSTTQKYRGFFSTAGTTYLEDADHPVGKQLAAVEKGVQLIGEAVDELWLDCRPGDAGRALYLLAAPPDAMNISLIKEVGGSLKRHAPEATIRGGDYPWHRRAMELTLVLSALADVNRVSDIFTRAVTPVTTGNLQRRRRKEITGKPDAETFSRIPLLI